MSIQPQLDPLSRHLLATIGRALIAMAADEDESAPITPFAAARQALASSEDGMRPRRARRLFGPRRSYSVREVPVKKLRSLTPAARRAVKALQEQPHQTAPDLAVSTGLKRKTVENILSLLHGQRLLVREDVAALEG